LFDVLAGMGKIALHDEILAEAVNTPAGTISGLYVRTSYDNDPQNPLP